MAGTDKVAMGNAFSTGEPVAGASSDAEVDKNEYAKLKSGQLLRDAFTSMLTQSKDNYREFVRTILHTYRAKAEETNTKLGTAIREYEGLQASVTDKAGAKRAADETLKRAHRTVDDAGKRVKRAHTDLDVALAAERGLMYTTAKAPYDTALKNFITCTNALRQAREEQRTQEANVQALKLAATAWDAKWKEAEDHACGARQAYWASPAGQAHWASI